MSNDTTIPTIIPNKSTSYLCVGQDADGGLVSVYTNQPEQVLRTLPSQPDTDIIVYNLEVDTATYYQLTSSKSGNIQHYLEYVIVGHEKSVRPTDKELAAVAAHYLLKLTTANRGWQLEHLPIPPTPPSSLSATEQNKEERSVDSTDLSSLQNDALTILTPPIKGDGGEDGLVDNTMANLMETAKKSGEEVGKALTKQLKPPLIPNNESPNTVIITQARNNVKNLIAYLIKLNCEEERIMNSSLKEIRDELASISTI